MSERLPSSFPRPLPRRSASGSAAVLVFLLFGILGLILLGLQVAVVVWVLKAFEVIG